MPTSAIKNLQNALQDGLSIVTRIWDYDAKNWVTRVCAADVDDDGNVEIIACSREGRVYLLSKTGEVRWKRVIGTKTWLGAIAVGNVATEGENLPHILSWVRRMEKSLYWTGMVEHSLKTVKYFLTTLRETLLTWIRNSKRTGSIQNMLFARSMLILDNPLKLLLARKIAVLMDLITRPASNFGDSRRVAGYALFFRATLMGMARLRY